MFKVQLGLKGSADPEQLEDRLQYKPEVYEFYTSAKDFTRDGLKRLEDAVEEVKAEATNKIVIHHPMRYKDEFTELIASPIKYPRLVEFIDESTNDLLQIAFDHDVQVLVHGSYARHTAKFIADYSSLVDAQEYDFKRLDKFRELGQNHIMFENSISPIFGYGDPVMEKEILARGYRLAFDTSHCFIREKGSNNALEKSLMHMHDAVVHYHLVDSMGQKHDSLPLGKGKINWKEVLPLLNPNATSIFEIVMKNPANAAEQIDSYKYLKKVEAQLKSQM